MADQAQPQMPENIQKAISGKLDELGIQGGTFEERVTEFKKQHWVDAKIGKGYLTDLLNTEPQKDNLDLKALLDHVSAQKPPVVEVKDLSDAQKKVLLDALNKNNNTNDKVENLEGLIKYDKNTSPLYDKGNGTKGTWVDSTIVPGRDGTYTNSSVVMRMDEVLDAKHKETLKLRASALDTLHTEVTELQSRIKDGTATSRDYVEAEAARKAARALFPGGDDGSKLFADSYGQKFGADAVEQARETWHNRSMAFASDLRSENFDPRQAAAIIDSDRDGVISDAERKKIGSLVGQAMDYNRRDLAITSDDPQGYAADARQADVVLANQRKLEAAITVFKATGTYGGQSADHSLKTPDTKSAGAAPGVRGPGG